MAIHHVSLGTNDLKRAKAFYDPLMAHLGLRLIKETERIIAYGLTETVEGRQGHRRERGAPGLPRRAAQDCGCLL
jgi:catechol 2,3-dioxygenase-like lactoylglutathione lyase family enzyme